MLKKNCKASILLAVCGILLISVVILKVGYGGNLCNIDYPYSVCKYIPIIF